MIWPMQPHHENTVREIFALCHPDVPPRAAEWYWAYPTLVLIEADGVVGFTSFSLSPGPTGILTVFGNDLCVIPAWQKQGLGWALAQARSDIGRRLGAKGFVGLTAADNVPMQRIFERQGFHVCQRFPGYFGDQDGWAWVGAL